MCSGADMRCARSAAHANARLLNSDPSYSATMGCVMFVPFRSDERQRTCSDTKKEASRSRLASSGRLFESKYRVASSSRCLPLMGLGRVELPTSRLSGVRSNHLSYRPYYTISLVLLWSLEL